MKDNIKKVFAVVLAFLGIGACVGGAVAISRVGAKVSDDSSNGFVVEKNSSSKNSDNSGGNQVTAKIYGVSGEINSESLLTRTGDAVDMGYTLHTTEGLIESDFDNAEIYKDIHEYTDSKGNVFVSIPKHYVRYTWNDAAKTLKTEISKYKYDGFVLYPCFRLDSGIEIDSIKVGKYDATGTSERATSVSGAAPLGNITIDDMRTACQANNGNGVTTYQQLDIWTWVMIQDLFKIEFATTNSQAVMRGRVDAGSLANSGACDEIGENKSGWDLTSMVMTYRGIENLYGNTNQWLDGINLSSYNAFVCYKTASYSSGVTTGDYTAVNYALATGSGNADQIGFDPNHPFVHLPVHYNGTDYDVGGYYNDYSNLGGAVMYVGGNYRYGSNAGLFVTYSYSASDTHSRIGGRLLLK